MTPAVRGPTGPSGPPEPPYPSVHDRVDARERVLRTAYELFRSHGVGAIGVDRIVKEAEVAKTTLYRHFHSKDDLVVAVLERHEEVWLGWLERETERRASTPEGRILALLDALEDWFAQDTYRGCLFVNTLLETRDRPSSMGAAATERLANVRDLLRRLAEEAGLDDPEEFARKLQTVMLGSIVAALEGHADAARRGRTIAEGLIARA